MTRLAHWTSTVRRAITRLAALNLDEVAVVHATLRSVSPGVMVDVGAHHGQSFQPFAADGWRVFAFEPDPVNRAVLERRAHGRVNVTVDGRAVAERDGDLLTLFTSPISTGISTLVPFHPTHYPTTQVETVRLDTYLGRVDEVTVLKIDAEGYDMPILRTFPWGRLNPRAVIAEFEDRRSASRGYTHQDIAAYLVARGYIVFVSEWYPVIEYGRRHQWRSVREYPTHLADPRGWGNLIGVRPSDVENFHRQLAANASLYGRVRRIANRIVR